MSAHDVVTALKAVASPTKAKASAWFFKTGPGQYGEGDRFIGVTVPEQRTVAKQFRDLPLAEIERLLESPIHEHRLTALLILVGQYQRADAKAKKRVLDFYLDHLDRVNNWDLVDSSAGYIVGNYYLGRRAVYGPNSRCGSAVLQRLSRSKNLWRRRVAIIATQAFISAGQFNDTLTLAEQLLNDRHDLMHKATGWMLREVGNRDPKVLKAFLDEHASTMPRTMLRYAIEKFDPVTRKHYLNLDK